jgi:hypothetical protein
LGDGLGEFIGYGTAGKPEFWIGRQTTGGGFRDSHTAFVAQDRGAVRAFFGAAGATRDGINVEAVRHALEPGT